MKRVSVPTAVHLPAIFLTLLLMAACDTSPNTDRAPSSGGLPGNNPDTVSRWDSAGVEIVENHVPAWAPGEAWTIDPDPVLELGVAEGDPAQQFALIREATRNPDGRLAVLDGHEIKVFDARGNLLSTVGAEGSGPGEFATYPIIRWVLPDTLIAWDPSARRISWFDGEGRLLRDTPAARSLEAPVTRSEWELLPTGDLVALANGGGGLERVGDERRMVIRQQPYLVPADGGPAIDLGLEREGETWFGPGLGGSIDNTYADMVRPALRSEPFTVLMPDDEVWELREHGADGGLSRIVRASIPRIPVTSDMEEAERDRVRERGEDLLQIFDRYVVPDSLPAIQSLFVDRLENAWVAGRTGPRRASEPTGNSMAILSPDGRWLGTVTAPAGEREVLEIGDDYLVALEVGEYEVEIVRVYRILK